MAIQQYIFSFSGFLTRNIISTCYAIYRFFSYLCGDYTNNEKHEKQVKIWQYQFFSLILHVKYNVRAKM